MKDEKTLGRNGPLACVRIRLNFSLRRRQATFPDGSSSSLNDRSTRRISAKFRRFVGQRQGRAVRCLRTVEGTCLPRGRRLSPRQKAAHSSIRTRRFSTDRRVGRPPRPRRRRHAQEPSRRPRAPRWVLGAPVPKRRPEAVRHTVGTHPTTHSNERHVRKRTAARRLKDHVAAIDQEDGLEKRYGRSIPCTRCSRPLFIRSAGTVQVLDLKSISSHVAKRTSLIERRSG